MTEKSGLVHLSYFGKHNVSAYVPVDATNENDAKPGQRGPNQSWIYADK